MLSLLEGLQVLPQGSIYQSGADIAGILGALKGGTPSNSPEQTSEGFPEKVVTKLKLKVEDEDDEDKKSKKKLVSGKCVKPDEADIKKVVKYPHGKFNSVHVKESMFEKLNFNHLVDEELKTILGFCASNEE